MDVKLDAEQVNAFLSNAIIGSRIGEVLTAAIDKQIKEMSNSYNNPFEAVVKEEVSRLLVQILRDDYGEALREKIKAHLTEERLQAIVGAAVNCLMNEIEKRRY